MQTVLYTMSFLSAELAMPWEPNSKRTKGQP
jgi:hypothetical protein